MQLSQVVPPQGEGMSLSQVVSPQGGGISLSSVVEKSLDLRQEVIVNMIHTSMAKVVKDEVKQVHEEVRRMKEEVRQVKEEVKQGARSTEMHVGGETKARGETKAKKEVKQEAKQIMTQEVKQGVKSVNVKPPRQEEAPLAPTRKKEVKHEWKVIESNDGQPQGKNAARRDMKSMRAASVGLEKRKEHEGREAGKSNHLQLPEKKVQFQDQKRADMKVPPREGIGTEQQEDSIVQQITVVDQGTSEITGSPNEALFMIKVHVFPESSPAAPYMSTYAQIDNGAAVNIISAELARTIGCKMEEVNSNVICVAGRQQMKYQTTVCLRMRCRIVDHPLTLEDGTDPVEDWLMIETKCMVLENAPTPLLIGGVTQMNLGIVAEHRRRGNWSKKSVTMFKDIPGYLYKLEMDNLTMSEWRNMKITKADMMVYQVMADKPDQPIHLDGGVPPHEGGSQSVSPPLGGGIGKRHNEYSHTGGDGAPLSAIKQRRLQARVEKGYSLVDRNEDPEIEAFNKVINEWAMKPDDSLDSLAGTEYDNVGKDLQLHLKPELFPLEYWDAVDRNIRPLIKERWGEFTDQEMEKFITDITTVAMICKERPMQRRFIIAQCLAYPRVFVNPGGKVEHIPGYEFPIDTSDGVPPFRAKPQRFNPIEQRFWEVKIPNMIRKGFLQYSNSEWRNPTMLVPYKDRINAFMERYGDRALEMMADPKHEEEVLGFFRFTMNLQVLNAMTKFFPFPLPLVLDVLNEFHGCSHNSMFDLQDAFWLVLLRACDREKTAFATHNMLIEWLSMPQGSLNGATYFAFIMAMCLMGHPDTISIYQDDIAAHAKRFYDLLKAHAFLFTVLMKMRVIVKLAKIQLNMAVVRVLGHIVTAGGFRAPDPKRVKAILDLSDRLFTKEEVSTFIGMVGFQREYIRGLGELLAPLQDIRSVFGDMDQWKDEIHGQCMRLIKKILVSAPLLLLPNPIKKYRIHVDTATGRAIGGILLQFYGDPKREDFLTDRAEGWRVVAYYSRMLKQLETEGDLAPTEAEALGMHECITHWECFLQNGIPFDVIVDHRALTYLVKSTAECANKKVMRMILDLQGFRFNVIYKEGSKHLDADAVSRLLRFEGRQSYGESSKWISAVNESDIEDLKRLRDLYMTRGRLVPDQEQGGEVKLEPEQLDAVIVNALFDDNMKEYQEVVEKGSLAMSNMDFYVDPTEVRGIREYELSSEWVDEIVEYVDYIYAEVNEPELTGVVRFKVKGHTMKVELDQIWKEQLVKGDKEAILVQTIHTQESMSEDEEVIDYSKGGDIGIRIQKQVKKLAGQTTRRVKKHQVGEQEESYLGEYPVPDIGGGMNSMPPIGGGMNSMPPIGGGMNSMPPIEGGMNSMPPIGGGMNVMPPIGGGMNSMLEVGGSKSSSLTQEEEAPRARGQRQKERAPMGPRPVTGAVFKKYVDKDPRDLQKRVREQMEKMDGYRIMIGKVFKHPDTNVLYELIQVRYDTDFNKIVGYRQPLEVSQGTEEDGLGYEMEGPRGIATWMGKFDMYADCEGSDQWPQSEAEMLALQIKDSEGKVLYEQLVGKTVGTPITWKSHGMNHYMARQSTEGVIQIARVNQNMKPTTEAGWNRLLWTTYLPSTIRPIALKFCHEGMGHLGVDRMKATMSLRYCWVHMDRDVRQHVAGCRFCQLRKGHATTKGSIPLQRYPIPRIPFYQVHVDCIVNLPKTVKGNQHIVVIKDKLSKWVEMVAVPDIQAVTVAQVMIDRIYSNHGAVRVIVTDNGTEFVNGLMKAIDTLLQQQHIFTTPYNPQANGQVENQNKTIKNMLAAYISKHHTDWDIYLPVIRHMYNTTVNCATGYTPFRILYGREAAQTLDTWIRTFTRMEKDEIHEYVRNIQATLLDTWEDVHNHIKDSEDKIREQEIENMRIFKPFMAGDQFYMKSLPILKYYNKEDGVQYKMASKLQNRFSGPHEVIKELNPSIYVCKVHGKERCVHINKMKRAPVTKAKTTVITVYADEHDEEGHQMLVDDEDLLYEEVHE